jgi:hypothetical protein
VSRPITLPLSTHPCGPYRRTAKRLLVAVRLNSRVALSRRALTWVRAALRHAAVSHRLHLSPVGLRRPHRASGYDAPRLVTRASIQLIRLPATLETAGDGPHHDLVCQADSIGVDFHVSTRIRDRQVYRVAFLEGLPKGGPSRWPLHAISFGRSFALTCLSERGARTAITDNGGSEGLSEPVSVAELLGISWCLVTPPSRPMLRVSLSPAHAGQRPSAPPHVIEQPYHSWQVE